MKIQPIASTYRAKPFKRSPYCIVVNHDKVELVNIETKERLDFKNDHNAAWEAKRRLEA